MDNIDNAAYLAAIEYINEHRFGYSPFNDAIDLGDIGEVRRLLGDGVDRKQLYAALVHFMYNWDQNPHSHSRHRLIHMLLSSGANVDARDYFNSCPLHFASKYGCVRLVRRLLKLGANVGAENEWRQIPLHLAAESGHMEVVRLLIMYGADIDARAIYDQTALQYAAFNGKLEVVEFLLSSGADYKIPMSEVRKDNDSPLRYLLINNAARMETRGDALICLSLVPAAIRMYQ